METQVTERVLLGDEAVAQAAIDAAVTACYAYPGTPSTEILEYVLHQQERNGEPRASWCANEKTAYESALGVSMAGKRALVSMKHVGLNVAADPFVNSALVDVRGGLVVAVADDPSMHSSQNEQDSRYLADFARILWLEPTNQQEAYEMAREAFELSERFHLPVMIRLVTRLAHSRSPVATRPRRDVLAVAPPVDFRGWTLLPAFARRQWHALLERQGELEAYTEKCRYNELITSARDRGLGVITTGIARNYYEENLPELDFTPSHLHIGAYPIPQGLVRQLAQHVTRILVLEEGYPYLETRLKGLLPMSLQIDGKLSGTVPLEGELDPDSVRLSLGLAPHPTHPVDDLPMVARPPQLCTGCPHGDTYASLEKALHEFDAPLVAADIGCYTLGALPPFTAIDSCVCMGASIGMARGAAQAGRHPVVAVLGDSTFLHSGITPLLDAVAENSPITVLILDNGTVAMTGGQPTLRPSETFEPMLRGLGVPEDHLHVLQARPQEMEANAEILDHELRHPGLSVVVLQRECLEEALRRKRRQQNRRLATTGDPR